jgi:type III restriction enzyme
VAAPQPDLARVKVGPLVRAFAKNFNLGFAIPYLAGTEAREYLPDFLVRLRHGDREVGTLVLETKGYDPPAEAKAAGARRWVNAVNADGRHGRFAYRMVRNPADTPAALREAAAGLAVTPAR